MNPIKMWNKLGLFTKIMIGFALGIGAGLVLGESATKLAFLGTILTRLLTMVVAPLVLGLLICAAADVKDFKTLGKIGGKTLAIFLGGTAVAVVIGLVLCNVMQIGAGFVMETQATYDAKEIPSIADTLMNIIPTNPFNSLSEQNLLQIIFFALLLGFSLIKLGDKGAPVLDFFRAWTEAWKEITNIVLEFTPYGVFGLMANIVGKYGMDVLLPYIKTIGACYLTCALFTIFVQGGLMVGLYGGISPMKFFSTMKEAILFVFATCSSVATIPLNLKCTKALGVDDKIADFVIPFGAVMNMNGTAIYEAVAVIFASQVFGIHLTVTQQIMVMVTAVLASVGTAGIPGSGLVMMTIVLNAVNLPLETIGLLAGIDRILNMARVIRKNNFIVRFNFCQGHSADLRSASFKCLRNALISIKIEFRNHGQAFSEPKMPYDAVVAADFADFRKGRGYYEVQKMDDSRCRTGIFIYSAAGLCGSGDRGRLRKLGSGEHADGGGAAGIGSCDSGSGSRSDRNYSCGIAVSDYCFRSGTERTGQHRQ